MTADFVSQTGSSLNQRMARGAVWMVGLRFTDRSIALLSTIVLARLLVPADFGLVALAMAMMATVGIFGEFGLDMALIRDQKAERSHYDTAWTLGLLRGLVAAVIIALAAEPLAYFFEDPRIGDVVLVLALVPLLEGFYNIGTVAFRKNLTLHREFVFRIVPRLVGVVATIAFAFTWQNYWALVCGSLVGTNVRLVMSYVMSSYRPRISLVAKREIMGFSKWMLVMSIASFASKKGGTFVIAKFLDAASLGIFSIAGQIANMASAELLAPVNQALIPGYARLAHDTVLLKRAFLDAYGILVLVALPTAIGIGLTAELFVPIFLGPKWNDAVPLIEILVISGGLRSLGSHVQPLYLAMNRPHLGAYAAVGRALVYLPMLVFALKRGGIEGAAVAHAIGNVAVFLGSLYLMHRLLRVKLGEIWASCWRSLTACVLMVLAVGTIKWFPPVSRDGLTDQLVLLAAAVLIGLGAYIGSVLLLWTFCGRPEKSGEAYLLTYLSRALSRRRSTANATSGANE